MNSLRFAQKFCLAKQMKTNAMSDNAIVPLKESVMLIKKRLIGMMVLVLSLSGGAAMADPASGDLLAARDMTEEEYLARVPQILRDLYGPMAIPTAKSIWQSAGPVFALDAVTRAYGEIWALKGPLSVNDRSLATISALVAQELYPEIKLHINGFLSSGGSLEELGGFIGIAAQEVGARQRDKLVEAIVSGLQWREQMLAGYKAPSQPEVQRLLKKSAAVNSRQTALARLSAQIALGNMAKVRKHMRAFFKDTSISAGRDRDACMDQLITHLVLYCGYPRGLNAFAEWQKLRNDGDPGPGNGE